MKNDNISVDEFLLKQQLQLDRIETGLLSQKNVLTLEEVSQFTGLSKSFLYKLSSTCKIPHFKPHGKCIYFERSQVEAWLLQNPVKTADAIEKEAASYVTLNNRRVAK
jgi:excisionase family DNA binding protein